MLHHCNVDRLFAMWQVINENNRMFKSTGISQGQFGTPRGANITADSPLKPFSRNGTNTSFHTSNSVADIRTLGYTYPEIDDWTLSPNETAAAVRAQINALYNRGDNIKSTGSRSVRRIQGPTRYYTAVIRVERSEIPLSSSINLVLNGSVVGRMSLFDMPSVGMASANIPLIDSRSGGRYESHMRPNEAVQFLQENITMEVRLVCLPPCNMGPAGVGSRLE